MIEEQKKNVHMIYSVSSSSMFVYHIPYCGTIREERKTRTGSMYSYWKLIVNDNVVS